ncbi:hypothetical protein DFH11DRAFT_1515349, partial [Phellopilus nigrolimitatus]
TAPSESWDDDFVFQQNDGHDRKNDNEASPRQRKTRARETVNLLEPGSSRATRNPLDPLRAWSESPTSPRHRRVKHEENWDDDFVDNVDSPARPGYRRAQKPRQSEDVDQENWDEDFEMAGGGGSPGAGPSTKRSRVDAAWDSSDDEGDDLDRELGFDRDEEDKTVTARSRRRPLGALDNDVPPVPPLPSLLPTIPSGDVPGPYESPFHRSPTHSVFSIPTVSGRDSITYGSTAHLALSLRRTHSAESSSPVHQNTVNRFPASSPSSGPRERRRLRKKSRPPHLDGSIMELEDRSAPEAHMPFRPVTPESRPSTPPPVTSSDAISPTILNTTTPASMLSPASPSSKSPLLTRIGSLSRWSAGVRRKHMSTSASPAEASTAAAAATPSAFLLSAETDRYDNNRTPRPHSYVSPSPAAQSSSSVASSSRFFRGSSGGVAEGPPPRSSLGIEGAQVVRARSRGRERPRVIVPGPIQNQSSQSGESEVGSSPRKTIRTLGQMLLSGSGKSGSPERRLEKDKFLSDAESRKSLTRTPPHPPSPLSGETPTRLRPRISHQAPSELKARPVFPRHASGSAVQDDHHAHFAPSLSARSVSASTSTSAVSSEEFAHSDKNLDKNADKKEGHRGFMGSMRRISLAGSQRRHRRGQSVAAEETDEPQTSPAPVVVPPVPVIPSDHVSDSSSSGGLLPPLDLDTRPLDMSVPSSLSMPVDLTSPSSSPPQHDRMPTPRRSGEPTLSHSKSSSFATSSPSRGVPSSISRLNASPQAASLGRASPSPLGTGASSNVHRRNSLGDLKIPSRISRAQDGLKRDLGRVREFAAHVEQMRELRTTYYTFAQQIQTMLDTPSSPSRATSPTNLFNLPRPASRARSNTSPSSPPTIDCRSLVASIQIIDSKYAIAWECAELLIELGTGSAPEPVQPTPVAGASKSAPASSRQKNRERAVTLAGDEGKPDLAEMSPKTASPPLASPPALLSWRASTGRHDLGQRQLFLLKEMLNNAEPAKEGAKFDIPESEQLVSQWGWDEGMDSTLTLPTEESGHTNASSPTKKKRRSSRLGMTGIRDMLRSLKRNHVRASRPEGTQSSATVSTESSFDSHQKHHENHPYNTVAGLPVTSHSTGRRRAKTSSGAEAESSTHSPAADFPHNPYMGGIPLAHKSSPRRPSLASLFRLGQKHKASPASLTDHSIERTIDISSQAALGAIGVNHPHVARDDNEIDSDWDRMDSTSDIDAQIEAIANAANPKVTLKLRKKKRVSNPLPLRPVTPKRHLPSSSQLSFGAPDQSLTNIRSPRLSNVDENNVSTTPSNSGRQTPATPESSRRLRSQGKDRPFSSVRTVPLKLNKEIPAFDIVPIPDLKLAMTPENIKPLLENARAVTARLNDCITEVREMLVRAESAASDASFSNVAPSVVPPLVSSS